MKCECKNVRVLCLQLYGDACSVLIKRGRDCTVVDVGCGLRTELHEMQRHMHKHGIRARTIGIDMADCDVDVDEFIQKDVRGVELRGIADTVLCGGLLEIFKDQASFQGVVEACAGLLKEDGAFVVEIISRGTWMDKIRQITPSSGVRVMTKDETLAHAITCVCTSVEDCKHGRRIS